jgi:transglutaminase-like putative cysteine protease
MLQSFIQTLLRPLIACTLLATGFSSALMAQTINKDMKVVSGQTDWQFDGKQLTVEVRLARQAMTQQGAVAIGQFAVSYVAGLSSAAVIEAYVQKPDGKKIALTASDYKRQTGSTGYHKDLNTIQGIAPDVAINDIVFYHYKQLQHTPALPNWWSLTDYIPPSMDFDALTYTFSAPKSTPLFVETRGDIFKTERADTAEFNVWKITGASKAYLAETAWVNNFLDVPLINVSTVNDFAELGKRYAQITDPMIVTTDALKSLSQTIVGDAATEREKVKRIYDWVRKNIRYVASYISVGGWQPKTPQYILDQKYGDCKDHVQILQALLLAQGIASEGALISTFAEFELEPLPVQSFNHIIAYVPSLNLYLDPTTETVPFPLLHGQNVGRPVVHTSSSNPRVGRTPINALANVETKIKTVLKVKADGSAEGTVALFGRGLAAIDMRANFKQIPKLFNRIAVGRILERSNLKGSGSVSFDDIDVEKETFNALLKISLTDALPSLESGAFLPRLISLNMLPYPVSPGGLFNATTRKTHANCPTNDVTSEFEIELEGLQLLRIPKSESFKNSYLDYTATYEKISDTAYKGSVRVARTGKGACSPEAYLDIRPVAQQIDQHMRQQVLYAKP